MIVVALIVFAVAAVVATLAAICSIAARIEDDMRGRQ